MKKVVPVAPPEPEILSPAMIGQAVRAARTRDGLRQADVARMCGVSLQTLVDIEAGRPGVGIGLVLKVADRLGVRIFAFIGADAYDIQDFLEQRKDAAGSES